MNLKDYLTLHGITALHVAKLMHMPASMFCRKMKNPSKFTGPEVARVYKVLWQEIQKQTNSFNGLSIIDA